MKVIFTFDATIVRTTREHKRRPISTIWVRLGVFPMIGA
jgi:hypothetical protein